jgi:Leucine-rich repeat (LRR) protein
LAACNSKEQATGQKFQTCEANLAKKTTEMVAAGKKCNDDIAALNQKIAQLTTGSKNTAADACNQKVIVLSQANADLSKNLTACSKKLAQNDLDCQVLDANYQKQSAALKDCEEEKARLKSQQRISSCSKVVDIKCTEIHGNVCIWKDADISSEGIQIGIVYGPDGNVIDGTDHITELHITGGAVLYLPSNLGTIFPNLVTLIVDETSIKQIGENTFDDLIKLESLSITNGQLESIHDNAFTKTIHITSLNLAGNNLTEFSSFISSLYNLRVINLERNFIVTIEWIIFRTFQYLEVVKFGQNPLKYVDSLIQIQNLKELDLSGKHCMNMKYPADSLQKMSESAFSNCGFEVKIECEFKEEDEGKILKQHFF